MVLSAIEAALKMLCRTVPSRPWAEIKYSKGCPVWKYKSAKSAQYFKEAKSHSYTNK
jgi:hypothetical protein